MKKNETIRKVLLLYANTFYFVKQVYPYGLDVIAHYLGRFGYDATIEYPFLPGEDLEENMSRILEREKPDLIGIGIRNIDTAMACERFGDYEGSGFRTFYFLPRIRRLIEILKRRQPGTPIIVGGGAFTISPAAMMKALEIEYGIVGEGEESLRLFLEAWPDERRMSLVPGLVRPAGDGYKINPRRTSEHMHQGPARRDAKFNHAFEAAGMPIRVKRGCNRNCSFCVEPAIEGRAFVFREPDDVVRELRSIAEAHENVRHVFFTDTEFNIPDLEYGTELITKIIKQGLHDRFRFSSQFIPAPLDDPFTELLARANFSIILTCDGFSDRVLKKNRSPHREADISKALELFDKFGLNHTVNLIFGLPGETRETVDRTIDGMRRHPPTFSRLYEYTVGGRIYAGAPLSGIAEKNENSPHLYGDPSEGLLQPYFYCSPEDPLTLKTYIEEALGWPMRFEDSMTDASRRALAPRFLADQARWPEALAIAYESPVSALSASYDYLFRKLADAGETSMARALSERFINAIMENGPASEYMDQLPLVRYYMNLL